nr:splicing factor [Tanacetum cinerariifolium]
LYYCPIRIPLNVGIKELNTDSDVQDFVRVGYENKWFVNLYVEHFDHDVMDFINEEANGVLSDGSSDEYYTNDEIKEFDDVDFTLKGRKIKSLFPDEDAESSKSAKSAPKSSKKGAKSTKTAGKSTSKSTESPDGWLDGCKRIIGLDGCFLKHTCRGELLTTMGRDANNQIYPIAWAVVKGLLDAVGDWLPNAEHRKCTRHVYANFKKKYSGLQLQRLFWGATSSTVEELFYVKMDDLKYINLEVEAEDLEVKWVLRVVIEVKWVLRVVAEEEEVVAGQAWVVQEVEEVEQKDEEVVEALQQSREEEFMFERMDLEREREKQQWEAMLDLLNGYRFPDQEESMDVEMYNKTKALINFMVNTQESVTHGQPSSVEAASVQPSQSEPAFAEGGEESIESLFSFNAIQEQQQEVSKDPNDGNHDTDGVLALSGQEDNEEQSRLLDEEAKSLSHVLN